MLKFKANIVKLDKCIVYQPSYIDLPTYQLMNAEHSYTSLHFNINGIIVYINGTPQLTPITIFLGMCMSSNVKENNPSIIKFKDNILRDEYYELLISCIKEAVRLTNLQIDSHIRDVFTIQPDLYDYNESYGYIDDDGLPF